MAVTSIRNETPSHLTLADVEDERLILAPLQEKAIIDTSAFDFEELVRDNIVSLGRARRRRRWEHASGYCIV